MWLLSHIVFAAVLGAQRFREAQALSGPVSLENLTTQGLVRRLAREELGYADADKRSDAADDTSTSGDDTNASGDDTNASGDDTSMSGDDSSSNFDDSSSGSGFDEVSTAGSTAGSSRSSAFARLARRAKRVLKSKKQRVPYSEFAELARKHEELRMEIYRLGNVHEHKEQFQRKIRILQHRMKEAVENATRHLDALNEVLRKSRATYKETAF